MFFYRFLPPNCLPLLPESRKTNLSYIKAKVLRRFTREMNTAVGPEGWSGSFFTYCRPLWGSLHNMGLGFLLCKDGDTTPTLGAFKGLERRTTDQVSQGPLEAPR